MSPGEDPDRQMVACYMPRETAQRLLDQANAMGWSRAELLRRLAVNYLASIDLNPYLVPTPPETALAFEWAVARDAMIDAGTPVDEAPSFEQWRASQGLGGS